MIICILIFNTCKKEEDPTKLLVNVIYHVSDLRLPLSKASVKISKILPVGSTAIEYTELTNIWGVATFKDIKDGNYDVSFTYQNDSLQLNLTGTGEVTAFPHKVTSCIVTYP